MKILLLGKDGQVGWELQRSLAPLGEIVALHRSGCPERNLCGNLTDLEGLKRTIHSLRPDLIVNAAAYTAVDKAEIESSIAQRINSEAPGVIAETAEEIGAWFVHYSTDYVFDGAGSKPWTESDATGPLNIYGQTKLEGEARIRAAGCHHLIFRTSWVYAARGGNFIKTMLRLAKERKHLTVINDQFGSPTGSELIADVTAHSIHHVYRTGSGQGTYHLATRGVVTWHGYAEYVIEQAKKLQPHEKWLAERIDPVSSALFSTPAKRPNNSRLDTTLLEQSFGIVLPKWQDGVDRVLTEII